MKNICEILKLNMQTVFNTNLKLYGLSSYISCWLIRILHKKQLFVLYLAIVSSYGYSDKVLQANTNSLIRFISFLHFSEIKIISLVICESSRRLKFSCEIQKLEVLSFVKMVLNHTDQVDSNTQMLNWLSLYQIHSSFSTHILAILPVRKHLQCKHCTSQTHCSRFSSSLVFSLLLDSERLLSLRSGQDRVSFTMI